MSTTTKSMKRVRRLPRSQRASHSATKPRAARGEARATVREHADIFFFYRPRVETGRVDESEDVQRFFMLLAAERDARLHFRLFVIGRKKLPEIRPGEAHAEERNWAVIRGRTGPASGSPRIVRHSNSSEA